MVEKAQNHTNQLVWRRPVLGGPAAIDVCGKEGAVSGKSQISVFTCTITEQLTKKDAQLS